MKQTISQEGLKKVFEYNQFTGDFIRKYTTGRNVKGSIGGNVIKKGYRIIRIFGHNYYAHRLAFLYMKGYFPENDVDHINMDKDNNIWGNLREVSRGCNLRNTGLSSRNTSGVKGVGIENGLWSASICIDGKRIRLHNFVNKDAAIMARWKLEKEYNFPDCQTTSSAYLYLKRRGLCS